MPSALSSEAVQRVLRRLRSVGEAEDPGARERVRAREAELGKNVYGSERARLSERAPLAVTAEVGQVVYALALAARPRLAVEFGGSLGVSTIYLAAALADAGEGRLITTELVAAKAAAARASLAEAGLASLVEHRVGDALFTLADLAGPVDLLFLDGSNDLYVTVLELLEARLAPGALVLADMSAGDPHHDHYRAFVAGPGWVSVELPLDAGLVLSTRARSRSPASAGEPWRSPQPPDG